MLAMKCGLEPETAYGHTRDVFNSDAWCGLNDVESNKAVSCWVLKDSMDGSVSFALIAYLTLDRDFSIF